jgi:hypothetical protein
MIDLVYEKKSLGFSSVTQVTEAWLTRYLPYTRSARNARSGAFAGELPSQAGSDRAAWHVQKEKVSNHLRSLDGGVVVL